MIQVKALTKAYYDRKVVDGLQFEIQEGEVVGLLGPNGAGKSTTMKMLTSYILPTAGDVFIGGKSVIADSEYTRSQIGYLPESSPSYKDMTVTEFLHFTAEARQIKKKAIENRVEDILDQIFLRDVRHQTIETLSKGYRQRVCFAQALIHDPPILILDEPTDGLDPNQKHLVRELIIKMAKEKTIVLSTHILEEMEAVCSRVIIVSEGKIMADGPTHELLYLADNFNYVDLTFKEPLTGLWEEKLNRLEGVTKLSYNPHTNVITLVPNHKQSILNAVFDWQEKNRAPILSVEVQKPKMEQVFRKLTMK